MKIYNYSSYTKEFSGECDANESPLELGVFLIPALATEIQPPTAGKNETVVFDVNENQWLIVADYRNIKLWNKDTAELMSVALGEKPSDINATQIEPTVDYPKWDVESEAWVTDEAAKLSAQTAEATSKVQQLLSLANEKITPLQDAIDLDIATENEIASLTAWKTFRVLANRVPTQSGYPTDIEWPQIPSS